MLNYLEATQQSAIRLLQRGLRGPVVNLNLLRFRTVADYSATPHLAPDSAISGAQAYRLYETATLPILERHGGKILFSGTGGPFFIGPDDETWDYALLVQQESVESFFSMAQDPDNMQGLGHRLAAISDSRLLVLDPSGK